MIKIHVSFFLLLPLFELLDILFAKQWILVKILLFFRVSNYTRVSVLVFGLLPRFLSCYGRIIQVRFPILTVTAILAIELLALVNIIVKVTHIRIVRPHLAALVLTATE